MSQVCRRLSLIVALLISAISFAQENTVRVGVAIMQNEAGQAVPGNIERDRLAKAINQLKPDKKTHLQVLGVPLEGSTGNEISEEAEQKECQYVVYTTLTELRTAGDPYQRRPGTMESNPNGQWSSRDGDSQRVDPEFRVTVDYKLVRIGSPSVVAAGPYSTQLAMNEIDAVSQVMDRIALRVVDLVKKGSPPIKE